MRFSLKQMFAVVTIVAVVVCIATLVISSISERERFYGARAKQWAAIEQIGNYPPAGLSRADWRNEVTTAYNVWGNVLYLPESATPNEMAYLQSGLDKIVAETNSQNSIESVERVFALLLEIKPSGPPADFIRRQRDGFREGASAYRNSGNPTTK